MNEFIRAAGDDLYRLAGVEVEHHEEDIAGLWTYLTRQEAEGEVRIVGMDPRQAPLIGRLGRIIQELRPQRVTIQFETGVSFGSRGLAGGVGGPAARDRGRVTRRPFRCRS